MNFTITNNLFSLLFLTAIPASAMESNTQLTHNTSTKKVSFEIESEANIKLLQARIKKLNEKNFNLTQHCSCLQQEVQRLLQNYYVLSAQKSSHCDPNEKLVLGVYENTHAHTVTLKNHTATNQELMGCIREAIDVFCRKQPKSM